MLCTRSKAKYIQELEDFKTRSQCVNHLGKVGTFGLSYSAPQFPRGTNFWQVSCIHLQLLQGQLKSVVVRLSITSHSQSSVGQLRARFSVRSSSTCQRRKQHSASELLLVAIILRPCLNTKTYSSSRIANRIPLLFPCPLRPIYFWPQLWARGHEPSLLG